MFTLNGKVDIYKQIKVKIYFLNCGSLNLGKMWFIPYAFNDTAAATVIHKNRWTHTDTAT